MSGLKMKTLEWVGNGALKNISLGFKPHFAKVHNITDGTTVLEYIDGDSGTDPTGAISIVGAAGPATAAGAIVPYAGDSSNARGLTINAANNVNGKTYRLVAFGNK